MPSLYFDKVISRRRPETKRFVCHYLDAWECIHSAHLNQRALLVDAAILKDRQALEVLFQIPDILEVEVCALLVRQEK